MAQTKDDLFLVEVDAQRKLKAMQLQNYANACGQTGIPPMGPLRVTNNYLPPDPPPAPAPAPATQASPQPQDTTPQASGGLSTLAKVGIAAAALAIPGAGAAGLGLGALGTWLANRSSAPATAPAPVNGQVTIGIGPDGKLFDPNAGAAK